MSEPCRILLVEDNPGDIRLVKEALKQQGIEFALTQIANADAAVRALTQYGVDGAEVPDVILLDYNVPRGTGREMLMAAARNPALAGIPKAVLTSSMAADDRETAKRYGARFIMKPAHLDAFLSEVGGAIAELLNQRSIQATG
jgi:CheY-like chemotaxis protein